MKHYISCIMLICLSLFSNAQNDDYKNLWDKLTALENEGLTKSAASLADSIYQRAEKEHNTPQKIKSLLHQSKYLQILEEEAQLNIVNNFKSEIAKSNIITRHLLESILAQIYWQYFQQNRWKFYNRTKTQTKIDDDFRTWDLETLFAEIHTYFQKSLQNGLLLQQESLATYNYILINQENSKKYRPTLYDLLSHNALEFYKTTETSITQPAYKFTIKQPEYFTEFETFVDLDITSKDSTNLQLNALKIYQNLLKFHRKNKASKALVSVDIERLNFVKQNSTINNGDDLLIATLEKSANDISTYETSGLYQIEKANLLVEQGLKYNAALTSNTQTKNSRWKLKEAITICDNIISKFPDSDAAKKAEILKQNIERPLLDLQVETFLPIDKHARILVNYKNINQLNFDVYKVNPSQVKKLNSTYKAEEKSKYLDRFQTYKTWSDTLKNEQDYQKHSTEIILPKLENGLYIIRAKTDKSDTVFTLAQLQVTNLALVETNDNEQIIYQIIDRNNGQPITNTNVKVSFTINKNKNTRSRRYTTDKYGQFILKKEKNSLRNVTVEVSHKNDRARFGEWYISQNYSNNKVDKETYNAFVFADRSIYRPAQTLYFKGIVTKTFKTNTQVASDETIFTTLHNVNGEKVSELTFETNEYGSFHGEFILPNDGLTGQFYIQTQITGLLSDRKYFSVEEYKRPKFEATFKPVTETYKVNDSITVKGEAIAFAGSTITDAKVVYRVKRQVQLPRWYYWNRPYYNTQEQEITNGEVQTNDNGEFEITFKAIPDESVSKDNLPIFRYEVSADITDINGETRSATTIINVGYHSVLANLNMPTRINKTVENTGVEITTTNLNGEATTAKGTFKLYKVEAPKTVYRKRPWNAPDYQVIPKTEFENLFPHDAYLNEDNSRHWDKGKLVFETAFDTEKSKTLELKPSKRWESGIYIAVIETKDKFGQLDKDEAYTTIYSPKDKTLPDAQLFDISLDKEQYNIGETAVLNFGSSARNISVTVTIEKDKKRIDTKIYKLKNSKKHIELPINPNDLGGFVVHYSLAAYNSYVSGRVKVNVPYPKTDLKIETKTFRDKLLPGQDETWSFKIKGPKGDKVAAEVLASMYDASLDEFKTHDWQFSPLTLPNYYANSNSNANQSFGINNFRRYNQFNRPSYYTRQSFDKLNWFGFYFGLNRDLRIRRKVSSTLNSYMVSEDNTESLDEVVITEFAKESKKALVFNTKTEESGFNIEAPITKSPKIDKKTIQIRKNLQETAFFLPQLQTDSSGNVSFNFKAPEALTRWKLQLLAHTKTLERVVAQYEAVTQKELMVIPNAPRFLRQGDNITISTKIANLTDKQLSGQAQLILEDVLTGKDITEELMDSNSIESFTVDAKGNTQASWSLKISDNIQAVQYKVIGQSETFSDGEQNVLPVLSNRLLVTETLPMWIRSNETKTFTLDKLKNNTSSSLKNHKLTLEITSNPAWYAVQALPYLMEYPYDCNEQTFSRYYANALAQHIVKSNPKIEAVFDTWRLRQAQSDKSSDALLSNLEKNQDLKSLLIQETPWLRDAQSETEQKKRMALLFDLNKMNDELKASLRKLKNNQYDSGAWPWFNGGRDNRYITQHIIAGFGHLKKLSVILSLSEESMIQKAIQYLDAQFVKEYKNLSKYNSKVDLAKDHLSYSQLHYLYVRSFYPELRPSKEVSSIMDYYNSQIQTYWLKRSLYAKGLMALTMHRNNDIKTSGKILRSLKENSITSEELGMYWKANTASWYWYQAPIETQALLIEAFSEAGTVIQSKAKNLETIDNLKVWLLKNKQTNRWKTTKANTEAVYALLLQGSDWLSVTEAVNVKVGNETILPSQRDNVTLEAGTGYYKTSWNGEDITQEKASVTLTKKGEGIAWGALYWQYFEDIDKITSAETPLKLNKKLFLKTNTDTGEETSEITSETKLNVGDLVRVRIELRSDRDMEFIHLKDMRAAGFEPTNVLSQYKWQDGLGYYESTKDASTNFFIDYLPKGIYVFEYDLRVNNAGNMSNGISTIQSMYAPEFNSHSEGVRIEVN